MSLLRLHKDKILETHGLIYPKYKYLIFTVQQSPDDREAEAAGFFY